MRPLATIKVSATEVVRRLGTLTSRQAEPVVGMVEEFSPTLIKGWVSVPADAPPTQGNLYLGNLRITSTYANEDRGLSGAGEEVWWYGRRPQKRNRSTTIRGPKQDRRNSREQIRTFAFRIHGIWSYVGPRNRITVRFDGTPLPRRRLRNSGIWRCCRSGPGFKWSRCAPACTSTTVRDHGSGSTCSMSSSTRTG